MNMPTLTQRMAAFVAAIMDSGAARASDAMAIPDDVMHLARLHLADAVGVALGASGAPAHRAMMEKLRAMAPDAGPATIVGLAGHVSSNGAPSTRTSPASLATAPAHIAALINGTSIHALEYDDTHMGSIVHGSSVLVPAVLAMAQEQGLDLDAATRLLVAGWELLIRLGEAAPGAFQQRGFQITSAGGVVVAALLAAAARAQASADAASVGDSRAHAIALMVQAAGIAGSQASGIFEFLSNGSNVKALHPGWAAHGAVWAGMLAGAGMSGPLTVLEGRNGIFACYTGDDEAGARMARGLDSLGSRWALREAAFKFYPCCHYIHPYLEAAALLREQAGGAAVVRAHCRVAPGAGRVIAEPWDRKQQPGDGNDAKYSLPYTVARALLGQPVDIASMTAPGVDAAALDLAGRITAEAWLDSGFPAKFGGDLGVTLADGRTLRHVIAQVYGSAERPPTAQRIEQKFMSNAAGRLDAASAAAVWQGLVHGDDVAVLCRCAAPHR
jgi:2-methylcitrate dehydratase PrpD